MQREPLRLVKGMNNESGPETPESDDPFSRIVEQAIRNGRLTSAEVKELRSVVTAALGLDTLDQDDEAPASDIDWRTPTPSSTLH